MLSIPSLLKSNITYANKIWSTTQENEDRLLIFKIMVLRQIHRFSMDDLMGNTKEQKISI